MNATCHRCGGAKSGPFLPCPECKHTPSREGRAIAWLFSSAHLNPEELKLAAERVRSGEVPDPNSILIARSRQEISRAGSADRRPLSGTALIGIGVGSLLLTPLAGFAVWWGLRKERPKAAAQALRITAPIAAAIGALWIGIIGLRLLG